MEGLIHHVEVNVSDLERSTVFWTWLLTEKFSYLVYQKWHSGISFKLADSYIVFVQTDEKHLDVVYNRRKTGLNHLAFHCSTRTFVDQLTIELTERNIDILYKDKHPFAGGPNYYAVFFEDPDRIKVEVVADSK
jgi:catechol 2,3-dioxygenase-like lactoylglutathione lyase family enzyme